MPTTKELLQQRMVEVRGEIASTMDKTAAQRARREYLLARKHENDPEIDALTAEIGVDQPRIAELKAELSSIAQALGAKRMSNSTADEQQGE